MNTLQRGTVLLIPEDLIITRLETVPVGDGTWRTEKRQRRVRFALRVQVTNVEPNFIQTRLLDRYNPHGDDLMYEFADVALYLEAEDSLMFNNYPVTWDHFVVT